MKELKGAWEHRTGRVCIERRLGKGFGMKELGGRPISKHVPDQAAEFCRDFGHVPLELGSVFLGFATELLGLVADFHDLAAEFLDLIVILFSYAPPSQHFTGIRIL